MATDERVCKLKLYLLPHRMNQDFVESFFGLHRATGGCNQNMTAKAYGYQNNS